MSTSTWYRYAANNGYRPYAWTEEIVDIPNVTPSGATKIPPPPPVGGKYDHVWPCFNEEKNAWEMIEDHRKRWYPVNMQVAGFDQAATPYWMPALGDKHGWPPRALEVLGPLPKGAVITEPPYTQEELAEQIRWERDKRLKATDYAMMTDYPISKVLKEKTAVYRQELRDFPALPGFPWGGVDDPTVPWPENPLLHGVIIDGILCDPSEITPASTS